MMCRPELLAPAGTMEKLEAALRYGADAAYLGGRQFSLRAFGGNFAQNEIAAAIRLAHGTVVFAVGSFCCGFLLLVGLDGLLGGGHDGIWL